MSYNKSFDAIRLGASGIDESVLLWDLLDDHARSMNPP